MALSLALALGAAPPAHADGPAGATPALTPVPDTLMAGLASHSARVEEMKRRGAFTLTGKFEELESDGTISESDEFTLRSTPTPTRADRITKFIKSTENGKDVLAKDQKEADEQRAKRLRDPDRVNEAEKKDRHLPFLVSEQPRYVFSLAERDANNPHRVRVAFTPKVSAKDAFKGSAWADETTGEILSVGFSFSKNPTFVDHVDITILFGLQTPLGSAPARISFDGRGGFLFIHKHYRGFADVSEPAVAF